ncbi:MAG: bifunctional diaminohydroxyphosphoribosylaminopyrimidine deaminase/5-amino-6-(5-phosphoribosylamino)uracil reductase RibD [Bacteroidia bacterium]
MLDIRFMERALELARLGLGRVAPNPLVGAVLVQDGMILGEGYHEVFGGPHAEVRAVEDALRRGHEQRLKSSTLFVNLEPCSHHGKTPPCTDLILRYGIPKVVVANTDPFPAVNGTGIECLRAAGVEVQVGIEAEAGRWLNRRFFKFHVANRPWILLKWAASLDGFLGAKTNDPVGRRVSGSEAHRLVHRWRSEESAIAVGSATALNDNPQLTVREWPGRSPVRILFDRTGRVQGDLHLFDGSVRTIRFSQKIVGPTAGMEEIRLEEGSHFYRDAFASLYDLGLQSVLVEGGSVTLNNLISENLWDEARIFTSPVHLGEGVPAVSVQGRTLSTEQIGNDLLTVLVPK